MDKPEYLYHYTSLETLALILENRTICFNSLLNVDDIEESETSDLKNFGKYVYVSCWTDEKDEMIPMWNLYTPDMHGVRIKLPAFPFEKHKYKAGEYNFQNDCESYIDYQRLFEDNRGATVSNLPQLVPVCYTDEEEKLNPRVRIKGTAEDAQNFISGKYKHVEVTYSLTELGRNKRRVWEFQKEWRYLLWFLPMGLKDAKNGSIQHHQEVIRRMEDPKHEPPYERFFLKLRQDAIDQMEVVLGPRMSEAERILAKALLHKHGLDGRWKNSSLKIR